MPDFSSPRKEPEKLTAPSATPQVNEKRRGVRFNSCVSVSIGWDADGKTFDAEAQTRIVGPYGCLVVLSEPLEINQQIRVTNLLNKEANPATIVWRGNHRAEGWEFGIELLNPKMDFWGFEL